MYTTIEDMYYEISRIDARTKIGEDVMVENGVLRTHRGPISVGRTWEVDKVG